MANSLLEHESANCQFYGALTFNVKLTNMSKTEPEVDVREVCTQLLRWLLARKDQKRFVAVKILATLSTLFIKYPHAWPGCIASVCASLASGEPMLSVSEQHLGNLENAIVGFSDHDLYVAAQFCQTLVEDINKEAQIDTKALPATDVLLQSSAVFARVVATCVSNRPSELAMIAVECVGQWVSFFTPSKIRGTEVAQFDSMLLDLLAAQDEELYHKAMQTTADLYVYYSAYFSSASKTRIEQFLVQNAGQATEIDEDTLEGRLGPYIRLCLVYCEKNLAEFLSAGDGPNYATVLDTIVRVSAADVRIVDDPVVAEVLEFWSNYVEEIVSGGFLSDRNTRSNSYVLRVIDAFWTRIRLPPAADFRQWSRDEIDKFNSFRSDFCDFLETAYPVAGTSLFELLTSSVTNNIQASVQPDGSRDYSRMNWLEIEASLYCLTGLSDIVGDSGEEYSIVKGVFSSSLWRDLSVCDHSRIRQTAVNLIGAYDTFFERESGREYLAPTLRYLFESLSSGGGLSLTASRSIQKLCMSSRRHLTGMIDSFIDAYVSLRLYSVLETVSHERTVLALSYVVQALDTLDAKTEYIAKLLEILLGQIESAVQTLGSAAGEERGEVISRTASLLKCIVNLGKGLQAPEDVSLSAEELAHHKAFWDADPHGIRQRLLMVINEFTINNQMLAQIPLFCESCCDIIRAGFSESLANPFVFDVDTVVEFIVVKYNVGPLPTYTYLIELASCLVTSHSVDPTSPVDVTISRLLGVFMSTGVSTEYEPDVSAACLKFLSQIWKKHSGVLLRNPQLEQVSQFALAMVNSNERFVLRAAIAFWTDLISLRTADESLTVIRNNVIGTCGQALIEIVVQKISGDSTRSDLQSYTDLLKKVVASYPMESRQWLTHSVINAPHRALSQTDEAERSRFVTKVLNLRGGRETNKVAKDFWLRSRGISEDYASAPIGL